MEDHEFSDDCPHCRPTILCLDTGEPLPDDSPVMTAVNKFWDGETTYAQRRAYIEVTLKNSRKREDIDACMQVMAGIKAILEKAK